MKTQYVVLFLIVALIAVSVACVGPASSPPAPVPSPTVEDVRQQVDTLKSQLDDAREELESYRLREQDWDYWQKVSAFLEKIVAGVASTRELSAPASAVFRVEAVDWAQKKWGEDYARDNAGKLKIDERIYKGLFLLPESASLAALYSSWPRSYLAAAMGEKVYFIRENFGVMSGEDIEKVLTHEVVHLLQSKHFKTPELPTYDEDKAWSGLTEGDADFTRARYLTSAGREKPPDFCRIQVQPGVATGPEMPLAFGRLLRFPYDYGQAFASALYQKGGWALVNKALENPPTTQQVMHPEDYLTGKEPKNIQAIPPSITGWKHTRTDRLGEHFIQTMLGAWLDSPEASSAARGWAGDRVAYFERQESYFFTWQTLWDSDKDAAEFHGAFLRLLDKVGAARVGTDLWHGRGQYLSVRKIGSREVMIIVSREKGVVDAATAAIPVK